MFSNPNYTTINLSFLKNKGKESYDVIRRFMEMTSENEGRVRSWNIERASLTPSRMYWTARAKEAIYKAFHGHGIEIPFPRRAVYIKTVPEKE